MIKNKNLNDYLYDILNKAELEEDEKTLLIAYIESIDENYKIFSNFMKEDENKIKVIKFLESLTGNKNV